MEYIGIDVSSQKLNIHIPDKEDLEIENTKNALEKFIKDFNLSPEASVVGVESTGKYHLICQDFFVKKGFEFRVINPILTKKVISATIRKKKTDKSDAQIISFLLGQGEGTLISLKQLNTTKKSLLRARSTLNKHRTALMLLVQQLRKDQQNPRMESAILELEEIIKRMIEGSNNLEGYALDEEISNDEQLIQSIPGFAKKLSSVVVSEVGDFHRFPSATQFKAYVGIDPKITQSGNCSYTGKITKRGNPYLRSAFYLAAQVARQCDPELKIYYEKKRGEGKAFRVAVCAVARKLCERVYSVVTKQKVYEIRQVEG